MKCRKCGDILAKSEEKEIREQMEYSRPEIICNECFEMSQNQVEDFDQMSDADMGL